MKDNKTLVIGAVILGVMFTAAVGFAYYMSKPKQTLPYFGADSESGRQHVISPFALTDQRDLTITRDSLKGKIYVADFFFTTCKTICPVMTTQMQRVYRQYKNDASIAFVSHTVDPDYDTPSVLSQYAKQNNANAGRWYFLTGDKKQIYDLARNSYFVDATEGDGGPDDFVHTQNFALVDKSMHLRGYYDGTDSLEINKLIKDIEVLKGE